MALPPIRDDQHLHVEVRYFLAHASFAEIFVDATFHDPLQLKDGFTQQVECEQLRNS